jgi:hypothetical protein
MINDAMTFLVILLMATVSPDAVCDVYSIA